MLDILYYLKYITSILHEKGEHNGEVVPICLSACLISKITEHILIIVEGQH
jgi:hypothetical protein